MSLIENVKNQRNDLKSDSATSENPEGKTFIFMIFIENVIFQAEVYVAANFNL